MGASYIFSYYVSPNIRRPCGRVNLINTFVYENFFTSLELLRTCHAMINEFLDKWTKQ